MEPRGIRRKVDDLGRIVIPAAIRRALGLSDGDEVEVSLEGDQIVVTKPQERCTFCGSDGDGDVARFSGKVVCWSCSAALRALDREHHDEPASSPFGL